MAVWPALALPVTTCRREQALKALKFGPDSGVAQLSAWQLWLSLKLDGGRVEICPAPPLPPLAWPVSTCRTSKAKPETRGEW